MTCMLDRIRFIGASLCREVPPRASIVATLSFAASLALCSCGGGDASPREGSDTGLGGDASATRSVDPKVATTSPKSGGTPLELPVGESRAATSPEERRALLTILRGRAENDGRSVELVRTVESELYRDLDRTPGADQWVTRAKIVDDAGEVLWRDRIYSVFQLLAFLQTAFNDIYDVELPADQVFNFAKATFPELLEFAVHVPLGLEGAEEYVLEWRNEEGEFEELNRFDVSSLVERAEPPQFKGEVLPLDKNGSASRTLDVAILGDGYTASQRDAFKKDARAVVERFRETKPLSDHMEKFNFRAVWTPSRELGAGYDCTGYDRIVGGLEQCKRYRNTVFEFTFIIDALVDEFGFDAPSSANRLALPLQVAKMHEVASLTAYDEIILLSNSDRRSGFAGMYTSVLTTFDERKRFPDVAVHEFGHSFGLLGDEYYIESDPCLHNPDIALPPNISATSEYDELKWNEWVEEGTPLPTPASTSKQHPIGAYTKAYNCEDMYRPSRTCMMKNSGRPFCAVCRQQLVRRFYNYVDVVAPEGPTVERLEDETLRFDANLRGNSDRRRVEWRLGGEMVGNSPRLKLGPEEVEDTWTKLETKVTVTSPYVRETGPELTRTFEWWVKDAS